MSAHPLAFMPVELTGYILRDLARMVLPVDPASAVQLQFISRSTRKLLLPVIYFTFVVLLPWDPVFAWDVRPSTPTMDFLCALINDRDAIPRKHIRHLVLLRTNTKSTFVLPELFPSTWKVQSITVNFRQELERIQTYIQPDVLVMTGHEMTTSSLDDLTWMLSTIDTAAYMIPNSTITFILGPLSDATVESGFRFFLNMRNTRGTKQELILRTLHVTISWPTYLLTSELARVGMLRRRVFEALQNVPQLRLVLTCSRDDQISQALSNQLMSELQMAKAEAFEGEIEIWSRLEVRWAGPRPVAPRDFGFWIEEVALNELAHRLL